MKKMTILVLIMSLLSCDIVEEMKQSRRSEYYLKLHEEVVAVYNGSLSCDDKAREFRRLSKKFGKHIDHENKHDRWREAKICCDFFSLFLQGRYNEAYGLGMNARPFFGEYNFISDLIKELAFLAKLLDRFPKYQEKVDLWEKNSVEDLQSALDYMAPRLCISDSHKLELSEWLETLEPPPTPAEE